MLRRAEQSKIPTYQENMDFILVENALVDYQLVTNIGIKYS